MTKDDRARAAVTELVYVVRAYLEIEPCTEGGAGVGQDKIECDKVARALLDHIDQEDT